MGAGFAIYPSILSSHECDALAQELASSVKFNGRAGTRHLMSNPAAASVARDERLRTIASSFIVASAIPFRATLFAKTEQANWLIAWHQDLALPFAEPFEAAGWGSWSLKGGVNYAQAPAAALSRVVALRLHLDDSTESNGPLRVIPNTHLDGVLSDAEVLDIASNNPQVECVVPKGGVIAMRPLLIHASSKSLNGEPRRVLHIEYSDDLQLDPGICLAVV